MHPNNLQTDADEANGGSGDRRVDAVAEIVRRAEVHYTTVGEMAYGVIRQAILSGVFEPGERLRQDALAEWIGVSRMPVRSALLQLEAEGFVLFHPHRGAVVRALTPEQIREIYLIREVLESFALERAIQEITPERLTRLEELALELDALEGGDHFAETSLTFYRELYDWGRYPVLVDMIERLHQDVGRYLRGFRVIDRAASPHAALLAYAKAGDAAGAVAWLSSHLRHVSEKLARNVEERDVAP